MRRLSNGTPLVRACDLVTPVVILILFPALSSSAGPPPEGRDVIAEKSQFTLFNPTPRRLMREMSTDRPDTTESPYTVDAGHFQAEISLIDYAHNDDGGVRAEVFTVLPSNLKVGLLNNVDLQLVFDAYVNARVKSEQGTAEFDGFGNTQLRLKVNLWGNDGGGPTAFAAMPFVQFPTADDELGNDHVEGGIILPLAVELPAGFGLGLMAELDVVRDADNEDYGLDFVHTATLAHDIAGDLAGYVEYIGISPVDTGATYTAIGSMGLTYAVTPDVQADAGVTVGISDSADDFTAFVGLSFRL
jgi:hypothetical protein